MNDRAWLEVDSAALINNLDQIQQRVGRSKIMAVVKDLFYGLGVDSILALQEIGVDFFATATIQEAIELRSIGIDQDILILGYTHPSRFIELVQNDFHQTITSYEYGLKIAAFNQKHEPIKTHLKINTGMNRLGVRYDCLDQIDHLYQELEIAGIFSHLLASDEYSDEANEMTHTQIRRLNETIDYLELKGINVGITHLYNSYGCLRYGQVEFDYCRPGLAFVGCPDFEGFQNVLSLKARVAMVKEVKKGQQIGYGIENKVLKDSKVATVTIGYGDGLERRLVQSEFKPSFMGIPTPFMGRISMDQLIIDVTEIDSISEGDVVDIINGDHDVYQMAKALDTIPNEVLTHLMNRLPRRVINEEI